MNQFFEIEHPDLESDRQTLEQLKAQRDGTVPNPANETGIPEETMDALIGIYREQGEDGLRAILKQNNIPDEAIEQFITVIKQAATSIPAAQNTASNTLPEETVLNWANNTVAVKTAVSDKLGEWQENLRSIRENVVNQGDDWANELAFVDALLAILEDKPLSIAEDNPYAGVVKRVQEAIEQYKKDN